MVIQAPNWCNWWRYHNCIVDLGCELMSEMWIQIIRVCKENSILEISVASYYNQKKGHTFHEHNLHFHASSAKSKQLIVCFTCFCTCLRWNILVRSHEIHYFQRTPYINSLRELEFQALVKYYFNFWVSSTLFRLLQVILSRPGIQNFSNASNCVHLFNIL
jgi:hypothetical protein